MTQLVPHKSCFFCLKKMLAEVTRQESEDISYENGLSSLIK